MQRFGPEFALGNATGPRADTRRIARFAGGHCVAIGTIDTEAMARSAEEAARFLKMIGNPKRMLILCYPVNCERNVMELEQLLDVRQSSISQELARLRRSGMVSTRRRRRNIYYRIGDPKVEAIIGAVHKAFCSREKRSGTGRFATGANACADQPPTSHPSRAGIRIWRTAGLLRRRRCGPVRAPDAPPTTEPPSAAAVRATESQCARPPRSAFAESASAPRVRNRAVSPPFARPTESAGSLRVLPERGKKMFADPSRGSRKPYPFAGSYHFTEPK